MKTATLGQFRKIFELIAEVSQEQVQAVLESGLFSDLLAANVAQVDREAFRKLCGLPPVIPTFQVTVDYGQLLVDMIKAGNYDWKSDDITAEHFPVQGEGKKEKEVTLFHFKREISSETAISEMDKAGYRPATIEELLALGYSYPELQKQFPIVALGFGWQNQCDYCCVPCLDLHITGRRLWLYHSESDWRECCRFAAVRK